MVIIIMLGIFISIMIIMTVIKVMLIRTVSMPVMMTVITAFCFLYPCMLFYANGGLGAHSLPLCRITYHTGLSTWIFLNILFIL